MQLIDIEYIMKKNIKSLIGVGLFAIIAVTVIILLKVNHQNSKEDNISQNEIETIEIELPTKDMLKSAADVIIYNGGFERNICEIVDSIDENFEFQDYWGYKNLGIANVDNHLNVRENPSPDGKLIGKMSKDAACEILEVQDGWAHVESGDIEGYVSMEYLYTGPMAVARATKIVTPVASVTASALKIREAPNTECKVITQVPTGEELKVLEINDGWVKVDMDDEDAYVALEYVDVAEKLTHAVSIKELMYGDGVSNTRVDMVQYAKQFVGNPYVWGGVSLTKGADCSGFVMSIYAKYGVKLPHSSRAQANMGTTVSLSDVRPGDLIFYTRGKTVNHVAMYIGNGQVLHASSPTTGIRISSMYYRTPYKAISLLQ